MNKKIIALGLALVISGISTAFAAKNPASVSVPVNQRGEEAYPDNAGWLHMRNSATSEMVVCSGRCLLRAIILSTGPSTTQLTIRNSSVADGAGAQVLPFIRFVNPNTQPGENPIPAPILLDKGITATLSSVSAGEEVTVEYRDLD
jgi:hypothetical protein